MFSRPGDQLADVKGIVIHYTGAAMQTAQECRNYFEGLKKQSSRPKDGNDIFASAHFIAGLDGEVLQVIPVGEMAYHVGAKKYNAEALARLSRYPNDCTIGIEMCCTDGRGNIRPETEEAAEELAAKLCAMFSLNPETDLWRHYDVTGKLCPRLYIEQPERWRNFRRAVRDKLDAIRRKDASGIEEDIWI